MTLPNANELAIRQIGRRPEWSEQANVSGAPQTPTAGVFLRDAPVTHLDVRLREDLRTRRARITVASVASNALYEWEVGTRTISYTSSGSATEDEILNAIVRLTNDEATQARAERRDLSGDGNKDTVVLESGHTAFSVTAADNDTYTLNIRDDSTRHLLGRIQYTSGSGATVASVCDGLTQAINGSDVQVRAFAEDTDADGDTNAVFMRPDKRGSIYASGTTLGSGGFDFFARGDESDNPHYGLFSENVLDLDADARQLEAVRFFTSARGDSPPGGWRLDREWTSISYRGLTERICTPGRQRGYIEIFNIDEGSIRSAHIGPAIEE